MNCDKCFFRITNLKIIIYIFLLKLNLLIQFQYSLLLLIFWESKNQIQSLKKKKKKKYFFHIQNEWIIHDECQKNLKKRRICLKYSRFLCVYGIIESEKV